MMYANQSKITAFCFRNNYQIKYYFKDKIIVSRSFNLRLTLSISHQFSQYQYALSPIVSIEKHDEIGFIYIKSANKSSF